MNKAYETQIRYARIEINKLDSVKATIFNGYLDYVLKSYSEKTFTAACPRYRKIINGIDPTNRDEKYILNMILKYHGYGWHFYRYLYEQGMLGGEYRFLKGIPSYETLEHMLADDISVKNFVCCSTLNSENRYLTSTSNRVIIEMIESFFDSKHSISFNESFPLYLASFLEANNITRYDDVTDDIIESCLLNAPNRKTASLCRGFIIYCLLNCENNTKVKKYPVSILCRQNFANEFLDGYRTVVYNRFDSVPAIDKWMLLPNGDEKRSTQMTAETTVMLDFSIIKNKQMRELTKYWFWSHTSSIVTKSKDMSNIAYFLNMFFTENSYVVRIDQSLCANYKSHVLSKWNKTETRNGRIYPILEFIRYLDDYSDINIDKSCYLYLSNRGTLNRKGAVGVKKNELEKIAAYINDHKNDDHNHLCLYVIFHIALNTEFRISQIVSLSSDCIKESMKAGEYVIQSTMKQSGYEEIDQPCARVVKEIITAYQEATNEYRENLHPSLRQYLFVREDGKNKVKRPFTSATFSRFLGDVCKELGLPRYTAKNLRITYITNAKEYAMKNGISELTLLRITNHANMDTINNHYIQEKIVDALQATIGVVIGDVNVDGTISKDIEGYDTSKESTVANGCGFCQSAECTAQGPAPCQRCKHFFTTISNIPFYKKEIERLKSLNNGTKNPHDAEDLIKLIRLNTYILSRLIELKGESTDGTIC